MQIILQTFVTLGLGKLPFMKFVNGPLSAVPGARACDLFVVVDGDLLQDVTNWPEMLESLRYGYNPTTDVLLPEGGVDGNLPFAFKTGSAYC